MKEKAVLWVLVMFLALHLLTGCFFTDTPQGQKIAEKVAGGLNNFLEDVDEKYGDDIDQAFENLKNAEHKGGPFENNLESAREYLLGQLQEKYGIEFMVVDRENLTNYGPFAGATYSCAVAPVNEPEKETMALVSQTMYQKVRDGFAVYFFKEAVEAPVLEFCQTKDYILDQTVSLEMPGTAHTWTAEDSLETFLSQSGAYVQLVVRLEDNLDTEAYAEQILDLVHSIDGLGCDMLIQAKANKEYIYHRECNVLKGFDTSTITFEDVLEDVEIFQMAGSPR